MWKPLHIHDFISFKNPHHKNWSFEKNKNVDQEIIHLKLKICTNSINHSWVWSKMWTLSKEGISDLFNNANQDDPSQWSWRYMKIFNLRIEKDQMGIQKTM